jgi:hypothetical protein
MYTPLQNAVLRSFLMLPLRWKFRCRNNSKKPYCFVLLALSCCVLVGQVHAESTFLDRVVSVGGTEQDYGVDLAVAADGSVYVAGTFEEAADFDPGPQSYILTSVYPMRKAFALKLDAHGNFVWAKGLGSSYYSAAKSIGLGATGELYVTGNFNRGDFDPGPGVHELISSGGIDAFVLKLESGGGFGWAKALGGADYDSGEGLAVDREGNVLITGQFTGPAVFHLEGQESYLNGNDDVFVTKLSSEGAPKWVRAFTGPGTNIGQAVATDRWNNVYVTGWFDEQIDADPDLALDIRTSIGDRDVFTIKLTADGRYCWASTLGGSEADEGMDVAVDPLGNVYTTGYFQGSVDFDPGADVYALRSTGDTRDIFVQKLDANGSFLWAKNLGGAEDDLGLGVAVDYGGNVYITGSFRGAVDFGPEAGDGVLTSAGDRDIFLVKLDAAGTYEWAKSMGGFYADAGSAADCDEDGSVYATGFYNDSADFDPDGPGSTLTGAGLADVFVSKHSASMAYPPEVVNMLSETAGPTSLEAVEFDVYFSKPVEGFASDADLIVHHAGTTHGDVSFSGAGAAYRLQINGIGGDGSFTMAVRLDSDVRDADGRALASGVISGEVVVDNTAPTLTLVGPAYFTCVVGEHYEDAGAVARDSVDGDITGRIMTEHDVDTRELGEYRVQYTVADTAGNSASVVRMIRVISSYCDVDRNGIVNIIDIQHVVNAILGEGVPSGCETDTNHDGATNVRDLFHVLAYVMEH